VKKKVKERGREWKCERARETAKEQERKQKNDWDSITCRLVVYTRLGLRCVYTVWSRDIHCSVETRLCLL